MFICDPVFWMHFMKFAHELFVIWMHFLFIGLAVTVILSKVIATAREINETFKEMDNE